MLWNNWIESNYDKMTKPSVDRLDDYKGYSLDNIQLMTWEENKAKGSRDRKNGVNNKKSKAVLQYDLQGNLIKEYYSIMQAERETKISNVSISRVCNGKRKTAGGFKWKYKQQINNQIWKKV